ncbi:MAG TPA: hypothetical protein PKG67_10890 [Turneriella sp.]|nr:hypothetical protein [Turneriella sp.]
MRYVACLLLLASLAGPVTAAAPARFVPPEAAQPAPAWQLAAADFLLPGYGTFRHGETGYAAFYFTSNLVNLSLVYLAWRNWRFYESAYDAASVRQATEPDTLYFRDPTGGSDYLSLQDIRNRAERGQLFFAISIAANVALRLLSATHTWNLADAARRQAGPRYEFYPDAAGGFQARGGYYFYF